MTLPCRPWRHDWRSVLRSDGKGGVILMDKDYGGMTMCARCGRLRR